MTGPSTILVSRTVRDRFGDRLAAVAPDARWLVLADDGRLTLAGAAVDAGSVAPEVAFVSNDVFYGPVRECFALLQGWGSLRWVQSAAAGTETPLYRTLLGRGTRITRAHVTAVPIAEYVLRAVLTHFQQPGRWEEDRTRHRWQHHSFRELWRTTWLVVGLGAIGTEVALRARAFEARVVGVRRTPRGGEPVDELLSPEGMLAAVPGADVVVVAAGGEHPGHLVDEELLRAMKPGSVLVNIARGSLVDEEALLRALERGVPEVAILDVFAAEPLPPDSPFWDHPRVVMTPHSSGGGHGRLERAVEVFCDNLARWQRGEELLHEIGLADLPAVSGTWHVERGSPEGSPAEPDQRRE